MPVLPTEYRVVGITIVVVAMAFGVQRWASVLHPRESDTPRRQSKSQTTSKDASKTSDKQSRPRNRRVKSGMSFRDLREAWSPKNNRDQSSGINDPKTNVAFDFILSPELQRAISQSRYPVQVMPDVNETPDLLMDLDFLTLDDDSNHTSPHSSPRSPYSPRHSPSRDALRDNTRSPSNESSRVMMITSPNSSRSDSYTRAIREWDRVHQEQYLAKQNVSVPAPLNIRKNSADSLYDDAGFWISPVPTPEYEPNAFAFRDSIHIGSDQTYQGLTACKRRPARQIQGQERRRIKRVCLEHEHEEPLPDAADVPGLSRESSAESSDDVSSRHKADSGVGSDFGGKDANEEDLPLRDLRSSSVYSTDAIMEDEPEIKIAPLDVDLTSAPVHETIVHETIAPAVVHEAIVEDTPEIKHEVITREIHTHDVYHRVLPIIDVEVLPSRHFLRDENDPSRLHEIDASALPALREKVHIAMTDAVTQHILPPKTDLSHHPRRFTARDFPGTEGDYVEYTDDAGVLHTERWWVHPPTLDETAHEAGKTQAFHFDHPDGQPDGFRDENDHEVEDFPTPLVEADGTPITPSPAVPTPKPVLKRYVSGSTEKTAAAAAAAALKIHAPTAEDPPGSPVAKLSTVTKTSSHSPSSSRSRSLRAASLKASSTKAKLKALPGRILEKMKH